MRIETVQVEFEPYFWCGKVLDHFARAEQALGRLSIALGLPITNGSLNSLDEVRKLLQRPGNRKARALDKRIERWSSNRPFRNLLAHASIEILFDDVGRKLLQTRHLPRDLKDVTPDRVWTEAECLELLRQVANDGRSICDHVEALLKDTKFISGLRAP